MGKRLNPKQLLHAFWAFFKIGAFTLGGGYAMIPLMKAEVVDKQKWIDEERFLDMIAVTQSAPGPIAVNTSIYIGYELSGLTGSIVAALATVLPSFLILLIVAMFYTTIKSNIYIKKAFKGIYPAVFVLIFSAAVNLRKVALKNRINVITLVISLFSLIILDLHPIVVILISGISGAIFNNKETGSTRRKIE